VITTNCRRAPHRRIIRPCRLSTSATHKDYDKIAKPRITYGRIVGRIRSVPTCSATVRTALKCSCPTDAGRGL